MQPKSVKEYTTLTFQLWFHVAVKLLLTQQSLVFYPLST